MEGLSQVTLASIASSQLSLEWVVVLGASLVAAATDLKSRRISNALTLPLFLSGLVWGALRGGAAGLGEALGTGLLVALPFVVLFVFAGGGAGDAKLMGAIGTWLGFRQGMVALCGVCFAGILLALGFALARGRLGVMIGNLRAMVRGFLLILMSGGRIREVGAVLPPSGGMQELPYGLAIFSGVSLAALGVFLCHP